MIRTVALMHKIVRRRKRTLFSSSRRFEVTFAENRTRESLLERFECQCSTNTNIFSFFNNRDEDGGASARATASSFPRGLFEDENENMEQTH